ncbi:MAG: hydroxymethylglutaryl-CoA reductase, degradative [Nitrososphaeria archaeon]|jgi:hydroxymethylglutaryl-CoA reductase
MSRTSQFSGFYKLSLEEKLEIVKEFSGLSEDEVLQLKTSSALKMDSAERMIENVIGIMPVPLGVAVNFLINGRDFLVPMAIEEPSVVAAASNAARMARIKGGFLASSTEPIMISQIQVIKIEDPFQGKNEVFNRKADIIKLANEQDPFLVSVGGGVRDIGAKVIDTIRGKMLIVELYVDCKDAMGANVVNTMAEAVAPLIEEITGGTVLLRIVSNLATFRLARASATFEKDVLGGEDVVDAILDAYAFAEADPYRCATHNKGIMNGITAVVLATGNDTRAIEAGAHAYAARNGGYGSLTKWEKNRLGDLVGFIELPLAVGIVGGATKSNPIAKICTKILGIRSATELGEVIASVGLAQNFAALRALATEGIQKGHMKLHARNIAIMAGATGELADKIAEKMVQEGKVRIDKAKEILEKVKESQSSKTE